MNMKKWLVLLVLSVVVAGCGTKNTQTEPAPSISTEKLELIQQIEGDWTANTLQKVTVSRTKQFGQVNPALLTAFSIPEELTLFMDAIQTAEQMPGEMDIRKPDYDVTFIGEGGQESFHLWLDPQVDNGIYTTISDTGSGYKLNSELAGKLSRLILSQPYTSEQAASNGDVVNLHGQFINLDKWSRFVKNVEEGNPDEVQITSYTIEGGAIFDDLTYDGEQIEYTFDNSKDAFGSPQKRTSFCKGIEKAVTDKGTEYTLSGCDRPESEQTFHFLIPK